MTNIIEIRNVNKVFKSGKQEITALEQIDLDIRAGEIFSIIGYSGAGKSTLVRLINGLEKTTSGTIHVNGEEVTAMTESQLSEVRRNMGMIFQHFNLMRSRTVFGNIEFPLIVAGWEKQKRHDRVWELLDFVGLTQRAYNYPEQLSGGQKQRVGIARALAVSPDVLLADEATSALDPETTRDVLKLLKRTNEEFGITIVIITHEMEVVKTISDRVAVLENGQVAEVGSVLDVFVNPQAEITQRFLNTVSRGIPNDDVLRELHEKHTGPLVLVPLEKHEHVTEMLITCAKRNVVAQIVYGNIDVLQGQEVGNIVVALSRSTPSAHDAETDIAELVQILEKTYGAQELSI